MIQYILFPLHWFSVYDELSSVQFLFKNGINHWDFTKDMCLHPVQFSLTTACSKCSIRTCSQSSEEGWSSANIHKCKHRIFPKFSYNNIWCSRRQLLWILAETMGTDWKEERLVCISTTCCFYGWMVLVSFSK